MKSSHLPKLAIVTGTSQGLGYHLTHQLLSAGWHVLGLARHAPPFQHLAYEHHICDLADGSAWSQQLGPFLRDKVRAWSPERLVLVNNAGVVGPIASARRLMAAALDQGMRVNFVAPAWLMGFLWEQADGVDYRVINISSGAARKPYAGWMMYCSSKAALSMAGETMALEYEESRARGEKSPELRIVSYNPGPLDTPMQAEVRATTDAAFSQRDRFLKLSRTGGLTPPESAATEIMAWMGSPHIANVLTEARYGDPIP